MSRLIDRHSSRAMGSGNMKRALARLTLEWDGLLQAAPNDAGDIDISQARDKIYELTKDTAFLWGTRSPVEYGPQDATLKRRVP